MMSADFIGLTLFTWIVLVILQSFVHNFMIETMKDKPIYIQWFIIRGMVAIFHGCLFHVLSLFEYLPILAFQLSSHIVIFAPLLNRLRLIANPEGPYTFWYLGQNSGWFDKLFIHDRSFYKAAYYIAVVIMVLSAIGIFQRYVE